MNVNVWDVADHIATMVASKVPVDRACLADLDVDLGALAETARQEAALP